MHGHDQSSLTPTAKLRRRRFLSLVALGAGAGASLTLLNACGTIAPPSNPTAAPTPAGAGATAISSTAAVLPAHMPRQGGPVPDFPSTGPQYQDGYTYYPSNPTKSWTKAPPGTGSQVSVFNGFGSVVPPTPLDQNPAWQEVNRQLNANVQFTLSGGDPGKMAALMASNDLPDIIIFNGGLSSLPNLPQFLEQQMADLSPYLGGDAVKDYPNLAALPSFSWKNAGCAYNGKLLLWPVARYRPGLALLRNADAYDVEVGQNYVPKNAADLKRVLQQLNRPNDNRWAWGGSNFPHEYGFFVSMFGAPNNWRLESDGKLTKDIETPEFKQAIAYHRDLFASGLIYPDAYTNELLSGARGFLQAHSVITGTLFGVTWTDLWSISKTLQPQPHYLPLPPIAANDGVKAIHHLTPGFIVTSGMKKTPPDRIKELLRIVDWLAAPFGSSEDLLLSYGVPQTDYNLDDKGNPIATDRSNADALGPTWRYIVQRQQVMSYPTWPDYARIGYDFEHVAVPAGVDDPTWGTYSATQSKSGPLLNKTLVDGFKGIVIGQRPMEDYDQLVADWKTGGGETIRTELQQALAAA